MLLCEGPGLHFEEQGKVEGSPAMSVKFPETLVCRDSNQSPAYSPTSAPLLLELSNFVPTPGTHLEFPQALSFQLEMRVTHTPGQADVE